MTPIQIGVVMGSSSDWDTMQHAVEILQHFGIAHEARVVSAHRMPDDMFAYAEAAVGRGLKAIIAGAANAALFAVALLANEDPELRQRLNAFRAAQTEIARNMTLPPAAP